VPEPMERETQHEAATEPAPSRLPGVSGSRSFGTVTTGTVMELQRALGNARTARVLRRPDGGRVSLAVATARLRAARQEMLRRAPPQRHYRLPTPSELKSLATGGLLPPATVEEAVKTALRRMDADWDLRTSADDVMKKLFPKPGVFDETAWPTVLGTSQRTVYQSVADAEAKLRPGDLAKLKDVAQEAADTIDKCVGDDAGLASVFGKQAKTAKARYTKAKAALLQAIANSDKAIDTDYNRDDPQVGLGGWANFGSQHIHLTGDVAEVKDRDESIITLIHEAAHLAHNDVDDRGYYGSDGFEAMSESDKVGNAAHYEELPRRLLGKSRYATVTFTPGQTSGGKALTFEDHVRREASEYLRKAWDRAVDVHQFVRNTARDIVGNAKVFDARTVRLLEISKMEHLTIHLQQPKPSTVTVLDAVLSEGVARGTAKIMRLGPKQAMPTTTDRAAAVSQLIDSAIAAYGALLGDRSEERKLMDWLAAGYRTGF
jgi:hypothetical protein